jgi:hypothetical protein
MMLTAARGGSDLYAFSIDCPGTGRGEICEPAWVGHADEGVGFPPLVAGGNVIVANTLGNTLTAFPVSCTGACAPVWSVPLEDSVTLAPVASGDLVFVPGLVSVTAFPSACPAPCGQVFRWDLPEGGPQASPLVDGDSLIVAGANTMYALRLGAAAPEAETSRSWAGPSAVFPLIVAGALFILIATVRRRRRAFP